MGGFKDLFGLKKEVDKFLPPATQKKMRKLGYKTSRQLLRHQFPFLEGANVPTTEIDFNDIENLLSGLSELEEGLNPNDAAKLKRIIVEFLQ